MLLLTACATVMWSQDSPRFHSAASYSVGVMPQALATGDFNGDGRSDVVVVNDPGGTATDTIHVLLANPDGSFSPAPSTPGTSNLSAAAVGDFDGDGRLDIVLTDATLRRATLLLGNGDGSFTPAGSCGTDVAPVAVVVADFDGDSNLDIAVANAGDSTTAGTVSICLGNGNGTLGPEQSYPAATGSLPADPVGLAVADFDGDNNLDIAVALHSNRYSILGGAGDGTFLAPSTRFLPSANPSAIAAGDLNGDGIPDLAIVTGSVLVLIGNGDTTFQTPVAYPAGGRARSVSIADMNGDGYPDLISGNWFSNNFSVLLNTGSGTFQSPVHYAGENSPGPVAIADFNGDGKPDVAVLNQGTGPSRSSLLVALNNGYGTLNAAVSYLGTVPGTSSSFRKFVTGDISGNGRFDIAALDGDGSVHVLLQNADFTYQAAYRVTLGSPNIFGLDIALADINNDGTLDLVIAGINGYLVLLGNGDGTFQTATVRALPSVSRRALALADVNNDGKSDLILTNPGSSISEIGILLGNGDGTFQSPLTYIVGSFPTGVVVRDFNGDNVPDIAVAVFGGGGIFNPGNAVVLTGNGDGTFHVGPAYPTGVGSVDLAAIDLNGDGIPDLVVVNGGNGTPANGSISALINNGDATFQPAVQYSTGTTLDYISAGDFNNDGADDVVVTSFSSNSVYLFENQADGSGRLITPATKYVAAASPSQVVAEPFTGRSQLDLAIESGENITILVNASVP